MLRPARVGGDIRQVDVGLARRGQLDLGLLGSLLQSLEGKLVFLEINAAFFLELVGEILDEAVIEVLTTEERVAVGRLHFEHAIADFEDGHVERAAAEVVHRDGARALLIETIGERRSRRLVDDAQHFQAGYLAGILGGLALGIVEVGWDGDDSLRHARTKVPFRRLLHLLQDEGRDLRGRVRLSISLDPGIPVLGLGDLIGNETHVLLGHGVFKRAADQSLDREKRALGIGNALTLGRLADKPLAVVGESHDRRCGPSPFGILDDLGRRTFHDGDAGVGCAEVDTNHFSHFSAFPSCRKTAGPRSGPMFGRTIRRPVPDELQIGIGSYERKMAGI